MKLQLKFDNNRLKIESIRGQVKNTYKNRRAIEINTECFAPIPNDKSKEFLSHIFDQPSRGSVPYTIRSRRPAKRLPFLNDDDNTKSDTDDGDDEEDFCTDDSDDYYGQRQQQNYNVAATATSTNNLHMSMTTHHHGSIKRKKLETTPVELLDNDDACSEDAFIRKIASASTEPVIETILAVVPPVAVPAPIVTSSTKFMGPSSRVISRVAHKRQVLTPPNSVATSSDGRVQLEIVSQPEQQHRARYQTEGSRGAVKDRSGNGFPIVRLIGYNKLAVLQVFIGTDIGRVAPHMFYQACKVAGKNSTQCNEKKVDGTVVIEIDFKPEQDMTITCDCVGILKERNVDVEHRFPDHLAQKNKKKSTRCRMVFRTQLTLDDGTIETLQVCSNPIICTQPPGVPEICKKSLNSCPVDGGLELFVIGKNFLKDTHVVFQELYDSNGNNPVDDLKCADIAIMHQSTLVGPRWEQTVMPDKEYLQQTHLICTVPPYIHQNILKPITVQLLIISSGKKSEPHTFVYTPKGNYTALAAATCLSSSANNFHCGVCGGGNGSLSTATTTQEIPAVSKKCTKDNNESSNHSQVPLIYVEIINL
uniref:Nuclear factor of activated T-cells 5 n=1 Tax=Glossina brevipalpis TaxID=37001 RepID=A0A1A9X1E9_9MUSC